MSAIVMKNNCKVLFGSQHLKMIFLDGLNAGPDHKWVVLLVVISLMVSVKRIPFCSAGSMNKTCSSEH